MGRGGYYWPTNMQWDVSDILQREPERKYLLEPGTPVEVIARLEKALAAGLDNGETRIGLEEHPAAKAYFRVVLQVLVTTQLFDEFFNSRSGLRAGYYAQVSKGIKFEKKAHVAARRQFRLREDREFHASLLDSATYKTIGSKPVVYDSVKDSLRGANAWCASRVIGTAEILPTGAGPGKIRAPFREWPEIFRNPEHCYIEITGDYIGERRICAVDDLQRGEQLHRYGTI